MRHRRILKTKYLIYTDVYFRLSGGWGKENRAHVFWSDPVYTNDDLYKLGCWYVHCTAYTEGLPVCVNVYPEDCSVSSRDYPELDREGSVQIRYKVGSEVNGNLTVELYSNHKDNAQCDGQKSSAVTENASKQTRNAAAAHAAIGSIHMEFMAVAGVAIVCILFVVGCGVLIGNSFLHKKVGKDNFLSGWFSWLKICN